MYEYKKNDNFYDIESFRNLFSVAQYLPKQNLIIISYLDDDNFLKSKTELDMVREEIRRLNPIAAKAKIVFEDLGSPKPQCETKRGEAEGTLITFARRFGIATKQNMLNAYNHGEWTANNAQRVHNGYYPVKDTDKEYDESKHGRFFGYNSANYDTTIMAYFASTIPKKLLNLSSDQYGSPSTSEQMNDYFKSGKITSEDLPQITANEIRNYNDMMFSPRYKQKMTNILVNETTYIDDHGRERTQREYSDAHYIRKGWLLTNRHVDIAKLNEKQSMVGLKRLAGMLGLQIKESESLASGKDHMDTLQDVIDNLAYNVSDIICSKVLFEHKLYQNNFRLRLNLLKMYPEAVYEKHPDEYRADIDPKRVKSWRLTSDSTSAQFVTQVIAPYNKLEDDDCVSFMYPAESVAKEKGIPRTNVLEDSMQWAIENIPNGREEFAPIYNFYKEIEGKNTNDLIQDRIICSELTGGHSRLLSDVHPLINITSIQKSHEHNTNWFYRLNELDKNGKAKQSSCMVTFSAGGIHGQEINMRLLEAKELAHESYRQALAQAKRDHETNRFVPISKKSTKVKLAVPADVFNDGATLAYKLKTEYPIFAPSAENKFKYEWTTITANKLCQKGSTIKNGATWMEDPGEFDRNDALFTYTTKDGWKLRKDMVYVSTGKANHEDFASYYPLLLSQMAVFINPERGDGADPYYNIFLDRFAIKTKMGEKKNERHDIVEANPSPTAEIHALLEEMNELIESLDLEQDSKKLLLNSASGAGDTKFDTNVRKNNATVAMRIIGQLFAWRIGQAQTLQGARVPSTNTDGLYTMDIDAELNDKILNEVVETMYIQIDPERLDRFVTKDSNNRMEYHRGSIESAKGGALTSHSGVNPAQSNAQPTAIDNMLANYLSMHPDPCNNNFDVGLARQLMDNIMNGDPTEALMHLQWIQSASSGSNRYPFIMHMIRDEDGKLIAREDIDPLRKIQHYNRVFLVKNTKSPGEVQDILLMAARRKVKDATANKRIREGFDPVDSDPSAIRMLAMNGYTMEEDFNDEAYITKISKMPENQAVLIENGDLSLLENKQALLDMIDREAYIRILEATFLNSWVNKSEPTVTLLNSQFGDGQLTA